MSNVITILNENDLGHLKWIALIVWMLTIAISWFLSKMLTASNIRKNDIEITKSKFNLEKELIVYRKKADANLIRVREGLEKLDNDILVVSQEISNKNWYECRASFFDLFIKDTDDFIGLFEIVHKKDRKRSRDFINNQVFRFFQCSVLFYQVMNMKGILHKCNITKQHISKETLYPMINFVNNHTCFFNIKIRKQMKKYLKQIDVL